MKITQLWVEKYRPKTVDGYVFTDPEVREQVEFWLKDNSIPHLLLHGPSGTGKTTLAKILINNLGIEEADVMYANGSKEGRRIEWVDKLIGFCQTMPFGPFKIVLVDEADYLNKDSVQPAMRNLMEEYSENVRFILTCNYPHKIIPPLKSRCHEIRIEKTDPTEFTARAATILVEENIDFDLDTLDSYVKATYPDLRKCLQLLQPNSVSGKLNPPRESGGVGGDFMLDAVNLFKSGQIRKARELICSQCTPEEMQTIFRWMYDNVSIWSKTDEGQDEAIMIIRKGMIHHASAGDPEINLSATITELISLNKE